MRKSLVRLSAALGLSGTLLTTGCLAEDPADARSQQRPAQTRPNETTTATTGTSRPSERPGKQQATPPHSKDRAAGARARQAGADRKNSKTLLDVDYESGTLDSGIPDLTTTHATAPDASAVVGPGHTGSHGVMHKVTLDDDGYVSDGAPRSESATDKVTASRFRVGDERRYEFSVLLKDWEAYAEGDAVTGDILFQGKPANSNPPSFYFGAKRNQIVFRSPGPDLQSTVVDDYRPYVNKWLRFRVDVRWADDDTGSYKISAKLPGQKDFELKKVYEDTRTWAPKNPSDFGYVKWGLYRPDSTTEKGSVKTRVAYHDDIRVSTLP
ncbi:heparin lyase I family protein [Streptomyces atriruber]|uniref:Heparin lyase I family protein n=1 Tax=Streptomyces atriruber TaxID=545121 RepID=A0ABV3BEE7_9ACTN